MTICSVAQTFCILDHNAIKTSGGMLHTNRPTMLLRGGDFLDEFRILDVIGDGGFSVVYKAEDTQLERLVAIKQLNPGALTAFVIQESFIRQDQLAACLNHTD